jgi:cell division protein FtsN
MNTDNAKTRRWQDGAQSVLGPTGTRAQRGGTLLGFAFGLVVAFLVSFGVVWYLNKTPLPFVDRVLGNKEAKDGKDAAKSNEPVALPGKPGDKPVERKFEFYDILEGKKQAAPSGTPAPVPSAVATTPAPAPTAAPAPAAEAGLFLQAGAFQKTGDAENLKARLAMLGYEANILDVEVQDKGTMHRVRIGPYANADELNRIRGQLQQNGIPATVVRVKD